MERRIRSVLVVVALGVLLAVVAPASVGSAAAQRTKRPSCIFDHMMLRTAPGICRPRARVYPPNVKGRVRRAIYDSSLTFGIPFTVLLTIGKCESDLNPRATNGHHFGLFQFLPATFRRAVTRLRAETGVVAHSYWNPLDSAYAAGYLFATGGALSWSCEHIGN